MKRFSHALVSWWMTTTTPAHQPMTTLAEREYVRKVRLLSAFLFFAFLIQLITLVIQSFMVSNQERLFDWSGFFIVLFSLLLNRRGYLKLASLTFFFTEVALILVGAHTASLTDPLIMLWACLPLILIVMIAGLFVPAGLVFLLAVAANLVLFWYLFVVRSEQIKYLLNVHELQSFIIYACMLIYSTAVFSVFFAATTKKAVTQADRAVELEQAHLALTKAYTGLEVAHDKLETAHTTIQIQALTDALTGLPNHRAVMDQLEKELERARCYNRPLSLIFFDADRFKHINDTYGHTVGDTVLRQIGEWAYNTLRSGDTLGRFGGEEFVLLLPETDGSEACVVAERIRAAVSAEPMAQIEVAGGLTTTVSIGVATYSRETEMGQDLLQQADQAMYLAKRLGRNQVRTAEEAMQAGTDVDVMALLQEEGQREAAQREEIEPEHLRETYTLRMIYALMSLLERRDQGMNAHGHTVSDLATSIAQGMGLESNHVFKIGIAALLHDIGKVAIPDVLLQRAGPLSSHEHALLREHAELGAQILGTSPFLYDLIPAVRHHHERWDGSGYPDKLRGADIPQAARIIAVAEAYDAMLQGRPYHASRSPQEAEAELRRCAGTQFDPAVVQAFLATLTEQQREQQSLTLLAR